jgi:hypothetical protein
MLNTKKNPVLWYRNCESYRYQLGNSLGTGLQSYGNNRSLLLDGNAFNLREFKKNHEEIIFTFIYLESTTTSISCIDRRG